MNYVSDAMGGYYDDTYGHTIWTPCANNNGTNGTFEATGGASNGPCLAMAASFGAFIPTGVQNVFGTTVDKNLYFGGHYSLSGLPAVGTYQPIYSVGDDTGPLCVVAVNSMGALEFGKWNTNGSSNPGDYSIVYSSAAATILPNIINKIEAHVLMDDSSGSFEFVLNGQTIGSVSGVITCPTGRFYASAMQVWGWLGGGSHSNVYLNDGSGSYNNSYEGVCYIITDFPSSDGDTDTFTTSTGTDHFSLVDKTVPGLSSYVYTNVSGSVDLFNFPAPPAGIQSMSLGKLLVYTNKSGAGARALSPVAYNSGTTYPISQKYLGDGNQFVVATFNTNPADGSPLTASNINTNQYGFKVTV